ncbi:MAG: DUF2752 domain-containing protein [Flavobacteriaceae bacterium]|jgi:hypothetical protein|nr:DUF2752 domain-containing protein [Flavobacteriaceae bacterium]
MVCQTVFVKLYFEKHNNILEDYMIPCMNKQMFGIDCPGCGTQRAFFLLLEGEFQAAFKMFPAVYTLILLFVFVGIHLLDKNRSYHKVIIALGILNAVIMIVSYLYKFFNL